MSPREELDLIITLIQKYELPLSPILEYAINEKKEEFPDSIDEESAPLYEKEKRVHINTIGPDDIEDSNLVDFESESESRRHLLLKKMKSFVKARSPQYIANAIDPKEWGGSVVAEEIDTLLKLMPEVEYVPYGMYQLKS